jgi:excisionase family DNA binding protein
MDRQVQRELLRVPAVALRLGLSKQKIYALATSGELPSIRLGRSLRFEPRDVDRFIRDHRRKTA